MSGELPTDFTSTSSSYLLNLSDNGINASSDDNAFSTISSMAFVCVVDSKGELASERFRFYPTNSVSEDHDHTREPPSLVNLLGQLEECRCYSRDRCESLVGLPEFVVTAKQVTCLWQEKCRTVPVF